MGTLLMFIGGMAIIVGYVWILIEAFRENLGWGVGGLLLPIITWIFALTHLDRAGKPLVISLGGIGVMVLGSFVRGT